MPAGTVVVCTNAALGSTRAMRRGIQEEGTKFINEFGDSIYVAVQLALDVSGVFVTMALVLLGVGGVILGLVMLKGVFGKRTGYLVILAGALTVMGTFGVILEPLTIGTLFGLILNGVWQVIIGIKLLKLGGMKESL